MASHSTKRSAALRSIIKEIYFVPEVWHPMVISTSIVVYTRAPHYLRQVIDFANEPKVIGFTVNFKTRY